MRVALTTRIPPAIEAELRQRHDVAVVSLRGADSKLLAALLDDIEAILIAPSDVLDAATIAALPASVRLIATYSVGLDHIDLEAARERGILIGNVSDVLTAATADIALMLILMCLRNARQAMDLIAEDRWSNIAPAQVFGVDLAGRTLGIVGAGRIGTALAKRAAACDMDLRYWSRSPSAKLDALGARHELTLLDLLAASDVVSLHLPSTPQTRNLINSTAVAAMRDGAVLINTARGDIIDDDAVLHGLTTRKLYCVGLDVFRGEPGIDPRWRFASGVVLLPHIGSATEETRNAMGRSLLKFLEQHAAN